MRRPRDGHPSARSIAFPLLAVVLAAGFALALAGLFATVLLGAPLSDRVLNTCAEDGQEAAISWHWVPPGWTCTRVLKGGRTVSGQIHLWSPDTFTR
jgi:hypothetical protein